eukprot:5610227-Pyramimonas_sp.AAC.1
MTRSRRQEGNCVLYGCPYPIGSRSRGGEHGLSFGSEPRPMCACTSVGAAGATLQVRLGAVLRQ